VDSTNLRPWQAKALYALRPRSGFGPNRRSLLYEMAGKPFHGLGERGEQPWKSGLGAWFGRLFGDLDRRLTSLGRPPSSRSSL
jgi:hypothetical protein